MKNHFETVLKIFGNETIAKNMIYDAAVYIDENEVPVSRKSKIYFVEVDSKLYPTKYLLDVAVLLSKKSKVSDRIDQNSIEANRFFENLGFITLYKPELGDIQDEEYVSEKEGNQVLKIHKSRVGWAPPTI
ncbi:hypothetical protein [Marinicella rhabdoformis]|uniref:hypothetical protein n=1 Tax=Marinicella rhabdoformis TaxID=2580566 RepID=UPI0012AEBEE1|nr:hypothetical protein [Marinicella rhabdoformis]